MTPQWIRWIAFGLGVVVYIATVLAVVKTLVVPRSIRSRLVVKGRAARRLFLLVANRFDGYEAKDRILAFQAPVALLLMLMSWLILFWWASALMIWPLARNSLLDALRESGSSLLTLGFAARPDAGATLIYFLAATSGLVVVALLIAYLPALYSAFNERERLITMLQSRGGVPAWGPEILWRDQLTGLVRSLSDLYADWERWSADVAE